MGGADVHPLNGRRRQPTAVPLPSSPVQGLRVAHPACCVKQWGAASPCDAPPQARQPFVAEEWSASVRGPNPLGRNLRKLHRHSLIVCSRVGNELGHACCRQDRRRDARRLRHAGERQERDARPKRVGRSGMGVADGRVQEEVTQRTPRNVLGLVAYILWGYNSNNKHKSRHIRRTAGRYTCIRHWTTSQLSRS